MKTQETHFFMNHLRPLTCLILGLISLTLSSPGYSIIELRGLIPGWDMVSQEYWAESNVETLESQSGVKIDTIFEQRIDTERSELTIIYYYFNSSEDMKAFSKYIFDHYQSYGPVFPMDNSIIEVKTYNSMDKKRVLEMLGFSFFDLIKLDFTEIPKSMKVLSETLLSQEEINAFAKDKKVNVEKIREQVLSEGDSVKIVIRYYLLANNVEAGKLKQIMSMDDMSSVSSFKLIKNVVIETVVLPFVERILSEN